MSRRSTHRSEPVDGLLLLNKPAGLTSNQALQKVKRLLNAKKAGHTGSLDPAATGMLPLCFGEATKVCAFLLDADKTYRVTAHLGIATDTGDADGSEVATADVPQLTADQWNEILQSFVGKSMQVPPMYSALKKNGMRLYELARKGQTVVRDPRPIRIDGIELLEIAGRRLVFSVHCSKGTYVRVLVEDIAAKAGTVAHTAKLHRETVAGFDATEMMDLSRLEEAARTDLAGLRERLLPPDSALQSLPAVNLSADAARRFNAGQVVSVDSEADCGLVRVYAGAGVFAGIGELSGDGRLAPKRVFRAGEKNP
ncbi:MAG: tRNA pseudouridine(55) synthase TruB [Gammaproteobacteria bacterium]|nr:tRNA pseudouridine(55) synthase TruB [Gammaproteobacteria bacterium]MDH3431189.1 tRNA pseudouridine(55) synthase TruB [Gammaproteobacteria bacterium]MDH3433701.1 tRNA pseudouridine(55) synthase TruB [Gammaproteobacteria bacterium]